MRRSATATGWVVVLALSVAGAACRKAPPEIVSRKGEPDFMSTSQDDPELQAAVRKARETLPEFEKALENPPPGSRGFAIKKAFPSPRGTEFIWLGDVERAKDGFRGKIDNEPVWLTDLKLGDRVEAKRGDITDWMYVRDDVLVGGYTVRVLFKREPPEKQREMEREAFKIR